MADNFYKSQPDIVSDMLSDLVSIIEDAYTGDDGQFSLLFNVIAGQVESLLLANQLVLDDIFIQTASGSALTRHGDEVGLPIKLGTLATGQLTFIGESGTNIPIGTEVSTNPDTSTLLYYTTTGEDSIPDPGVPAAPTIAQGTATGLTGAYDYQVTFVTASGETSASSFSSLLNVSNHKIDLSVIPLGGPGTISRNIYRRKSGVFQGKVTTIADNSTTTYTDNIADGSIVVANPPSASTANSVTINAVAEDYGAEYNVIVGSISQLTSVPSGVTSVTNATPFGDSSYDYIPGENPEEIDLYRSRLLQFKKSPQTGSATDVQNWTLEVDGVSTASVFSNNNLGTPQNGHITVRISGPDGIVPGMTIVNNVQDFLDSKDLANLQIHVTTFTPVSVDVDITVTLADGFVLGDVSDAVTINIENYINSIPAGGTVYVAGLVDSVFGDVPGVLTVDVTSPVSDTTTSSSQKPVAGTINVSD